MILIIEKEAMIEACAQVAYETLRTWDRVHEKDMARAWSTSPPWVRTLTIACARAVIVEGTTPEQTHNRRMMLLSEMDWVYGQVYDEQLKTCPAMVSWSILPRQAKAEETIFGKTVQVIYVGLQQGDT